MTGLEKMVSQILEEADASAAVMISDAEKKAAEILGEAGEKLIRSGSRGKNSPGQR